MIFISNIKYVFSLFLILSIFSGISNSQSFDEKDTLNEGVDPVIALNKFIKFSKGNVKNKLFYDGKLNGYINGEKIFIKNFLSQEIFEFETENYDSVQFFYEWDDYLVDGFFLKVYDNEPFTFLPIPVLPIIETDGLNMVIKSVAKSKGKKLYEIKISDDVDPKQIEVTALDESLPFIDIKKGDSATYYIFLKEKDDFNNNASTELLENIKKGQEVIIPVGVIMKDKVVSSDVQPYKQYLKKKKKPKPKS